MSVRERLADGVRRVRDRREQQSEQRFAERFGRHWARMRPREVDRPAPVVVEQGESNFARARVPYGVDLAAAWAWRFLVVAGAGYVIGRGIAKFEVIVLPLVIALLLTALVVPVVKLLQRLRVPRGLAAFLVVIGVFVVVGVLLGAAGQQIANGANDLSNQVVAGLEQIRVWLRNGPLHISDNQLNVYLKQAQHAITSGNQHLVGRVTELGTLVSQIVAGFFVIVFSTYFFLADGERIWSWLVRAFPRVARARADSSGRVAWLSVTRFVRATVLVAFTDALGIMLIAAILRVPFVFAIGVLVFLGAFIPVIGATLSGSVAVLVALVAHGPIVALVMLGGVILVQQVEAHVLQPFLLGRLVALHPLGVIIAIAAGVLIAGIPGALVAVPVVAALNAVVLHLADTSAAPVPATGPAEPPDGEPPAPEPKQSAKVPPER